MIKPLLSAEDNPRQHELTTLVDGTLEKRDGFTSLFARAGADWTHNQLFKRAVRDISFGEEFVVGAKFDKKRQVTAVATMTAMPQGFPTLHSTVTLRDFVTGTDHHFTLDAYLRHGPTRPYKFEPTSPPSAPTK